MSGKVAAHRFSHTSRVLLQQVNQVWRAEFAKLGEAIGAAIDRFLEDLLCDPRRGIQGQYQQHWVMTKVN